jgi:hypothetical protein
MKIFAFLLLTMMPLVALSQQPTTGQVISENFQKGRAMRQAYEDRKEEKELEQLRQGEEQREAEILRRKNESLALNAQLEYAQKNIYEIYQSKNSLPDIRISSAAVVCEFPERPAFTRDTNGEIVFGCASVLPDKLKIVWHLYGTKEYDMTQWSKKSPVSADHTALGE